LRGRFRPGTDVSAELLALLATPTIAEKRWVWSQYDHQLFLNTVVAPGADAAVLRVKGTAKALALSTDGKGRFCRLDPRTGGRLVVVEAARNVACAGAAPLALVNCLNFGNPEHPEVMWSFAEVVEGIAEACEAFGLPVVGGNVSFYNESQGADIDPTPVVAVLGLIDDLRARPPIPHLGSADRIVLLGLTDAELGGSEWAAVLHGHGDGRPPRADLDAARALHELTVDLVASGRLAGVHDCSDGGLAVALSEMACGGDTGFSVDLARVPTTSSAALTPAEICFSESTSRVVVAVSPADLPRVLAMAADAGVPAAEIGEAGGDRLRADGAFDVSLADAHQAWSSGLPAALGAEATALLP
jgi:phosphoribosylformylglycinamidine (FGAM) synthase-like enzyme